MKQKYKELRQLSYLLNIWNDYIDNYNINFDDISSQVINFFETESALTYPAKSFFVAIIYAKAFETYFGENFYDMLDDKELLIDDKYFVIYSDAKHIYDKILTKIDTSKILYYNSAKTTVQYFKQEFLCS